MFVPGHPRPAIAHGLTAIPVKIDSVAVAELV
jgi:hypothetical protein